MKQITHTQLASLVKSHKGVLFLGITAITDTKAKKTGNPFGTILKKSRFVGVSGADYESAVQRAGAENFNAEKLPWGEFVPDSGRKLIAHKGGLYLRCQTTGKQRKHRKAVVQYFAQGKKVSRDAVAPFLPSTNSAKQASAGVGEENQVQVRTFSFESLQSVRVNGQSFAVVQD